MGEIAGATAATESLRKMLMMEVTVKELDEGREAARAVHGQACTLMKCAYDALVAGGVPRTAELFRGGLEIRSIVGSTRDFSVHGRMRRAGWLAGCWRSEQEWTYVPPALEDDPELGGNSVRCAFLGSACMGLGRCFGRS
jgi:hypothetical protein